MRCVVVLGQGNVHAAIQQLCQTIEKEEENSKRKYNYENSSSPGRYVEEMTGIECFLQALRTAMCGSFRRAVRGTSYLIAESCCVAMPTLCQLRKSKLLPEVIPTLSRRLGRLEPATHVS